MYCNKNVLVVVPARGGSKGVSLKNLRELCGVPLVSIVGRVVKRLSFPDRVVVSTDHPAIADAAERAGISAPFRRPAKLSGDRIGDWEVLRHALVEVERLDQQVYDIIIMLQPTSPLRTPAQVQGTIDRLWDGRYDAVWSVSQSDAKAHPLKQLVIEAESDLSYYDPSASRIVARQELTPVYHKNGVAYAFTRVCLMESKNIRGQRLGAYVVREPVANIDTVEDLLWAEFMARRLRLDWLTGDSVSDNLPQR